MKLLGPTAPLPLYPGPFFTPTLPRTMCVPVFPDCPKANRNKYHIDPSSQVSVSSIPQLPCLTLYALDQSKLKQTMSDKWPQPTYASLAIIYNSAGKYMLTIGLLNVHPSQAVWISLLRRSFVGTAPSGKLYDNSKNSSSRIQRIHT